jgi:RNA polymerase sigma factor (sigma-70 family)
VTPRRLIEPARLAGSTLLRTQTDSRLIDLVRAGHASAFEAIVQRYRRPLLAHCSRLLPEARAEDAVQQTFLSAYQAMTRGEADLNLRPWLYRIAHNASLNLLRQNGWSYDQLSDHLDGVERPEQALERRERLRSTLDAVKALPERQRDALVLRELEGMSYDEIATTLGVGDGAVRQLLHRARATLRSGLTAVTPVGLVERLAAALASTGGDPSARVAEVAAGVGIGAGAVKVGAAVLATGAIATGVVAVPIVKHHHRSASNHTAEAATGAVAVKPPGGNAPNVEVDDHIKRGSGSSHHGTPRHHSGSNSGKGSDDHHSGRSPVSGGGGDDRNNSGPPLRRQRHSGSGEGGDDQQRSVTAPGGDGSGRSGSDDNTINVSGDGSGGDHSGSGDGGDATATTPTGTTGVTGPVTTDTSGKDGGGSGSGDGSTSGGSGGGTTGGD